MINKSIIPEIINNLNKLKQADELSDNAINKVQVTLTNQITQLFKSSAKKYELCMYAIYKHCQKNVLYSSNYLANILMEDLGFNKKTAGKYVTLLQEKYHLGKTYRISFDYNKYKKVTIGEKDKSLNFYKINATYYDYYRQKKLLSYDSILKMIVRRGFTPKKEDSVKVVKLLLGDKDDN